MALASKTVWVVSDHRPHLFAKISCIDVIPSNKKSEVHRDHKNARRRMLEQIMDTDTDHVVFGSTVFYYASTYIVFVIVMLMVM